MATKVHELSLSVPQTCSAMRIDAFVAKAHQSFPRSAASDERTEFYLNGKQVKKSKLVHGGDHITVRWPEDVLSSVVPQDIPLKVLYEDDEILVIDKQQSLVVHPAAGHFDGTVANAMVYRYGKQMLQLDMSSLRPGIVHRLDKETSGVMVIAKTRTSHASLAKQFKDHTTIKYYIAIVQGSVPGQEGQITMPIQRDMHNRKRFTVGVDGKEACTEYYVLRRFVGYTLLRLRLITGRTHQIRVHMRYLGTPVLGDSLYGKASKEFPDASLMLHALSLDIEHPLTGKRMRFVAPMPTRFKTVLRQLLQER